MLEQCGDASVGSVKKRIQDVGNTNYSIYACKTKRTLCAVTLIFSHTHSVSLSFALEIMFYLKFSQSGERDLVLEPLLLVLACSWILFVSEPRILVRSTQDILLPLAVCQECWVALPGVTLVSPSIIKEAGTGWGPKMRGCRKLQECCPSHFPPRP